MKKSLQVSRDKHYARLRKYKRELAAFEKRFQMPSDAFYSRFESGEMGDNVDYFEWAGLYELFQDALDKVRHLETSL